MSKESTMNNLSGHYELSLARQGIFSVSDASGVDIHCRTGCIWLTLDGDTRDVVLEAGESFSTTEHRRAVIYAMSAADVGIGTTATRGRDSRTAAVRAPSRVSFALEPVAA
jgi:hypothetical protein